MESVDLSSSNVFTPNETSELGAINLRLGLVVAVDELAC